MSPSYEIMYLKSHRVLKKDKEHLCCTLCRTRKYRVLYPRLKRWIKNGKTH